MKMFSISWKICLIELSNKLNLTYTAILPEAEYGSDKLSEIDSDSHKNVMVVHALIKVVLS